MPRFGPNAPRALLARLAPWLLKPNRYVQISPAAGPSIPTWEAVPGDGILWVPLGSTLRILLEGRDGAELRRQTEAELFRLGPGAQNVRLEQVRGAPGGDGTSVDSEPESYAILTALEVGTSTLLLEADALAGTDQDASGVVRIEHSLTVIVYRKAVRLALFMKLARETRERGPYGNAGDALVIPFSETATLRMVGLDAEGVEVPLSGQTFDDVSGVYHLDAISPGVVLLTPDAPGGGGLNFSAEGDPSPAAGALESSIVVIVSPTIADHIAPRFSIAPS